MDFRNRGPQPHVAPAQPANQPVNNPAAGGLGAKFHNKNKWFARGERVMLVAGALLIAAIAFLLYMGGPNESKAVNTDKYQAVFLNNGQVYFGKVKGINDKFIDLQSIYYLQTNGNGEIQTQQQSANVSLVKLGCELHAPYDQMVINADQVIFWENLQDNSQVVKAINDYKKQNPKGQTCSEQSQNSTQQAPAAAAPSSSTTPAAPAAGAGAAAPAQNAAPATNSTNTNRP